MGADARSTPRVLPRAARRHHERNVCSGTRASRAAIVDREPHPPPHGRPPLTPPVDIVIVNWNGGEKTIHCLETVMPQAREVPGAVVTVVDNGSTDGSIAEITSRFPSVRFIALGSNRGFTGGIAAAIATSRARNVVFVNNDAVAEPEWLVSLQSSLDDAPDDVIAAGGRIISIDGSRIDFIGGVLTFDGHAFQEGFRKPIGSREEPSAGSDILFGCGGNMIVRREPYVELGGFDDDYFAYLEDVDFGWRSWLAGHRAIYQPRATVRHHSSATSNRLGDFERGVLFERNALQTVLKNAEDLRATAGSVLFTYLHRLHHYATTRNPGSDELRRDMGAPSPRAPRPGLRARVGRKLRGQPPLARIDDPLTAMQFRAFDWVLRHEAGIAEKRRAIQERRRRSDREIFERFPLHVVPTYPGDASLMKGPLFELLLPGLPLLRRELDDIIDR